MAHSAPWPSNVSRFPVCKSSRLCGLIPSSLKEHRMRPTLRAATNLRAYLLIGVLLMMAGTLFAASSIYSFALNSIDGQPTPLANYKGKVIMVVNVASQCGYTPQYSALEANYEKY